jgi:3-oxoacyl-[acyl-carrier protein] reductase/2-[hydroxy(phenyl)methyl]-succinyl-CoA dehydrogenase BbsC subunit
MKGKVALIAGAANDVGRAISARFARNGAKLVLVDADVQKLSALASTIGEEGIRAEVMAINLTDANAVRYAVKRIVDTLGTIDILVNNIDCRDGVALAEGSLDSWQHSFQENLVPVIALSLGVIPVMKQRQYGRIVSVGSLDYLGTAGQSNYSAAKSALFGLTRAFALELAREGITVNQVLKGDIKTAETPLSAEAEEKGGAQLPVQRLGRPDDISYAVAYLASDTSRYVTGQNLIVCGGKSIYSSMSA